MRAVYRVVSLVDVEGDTAADLAYAAEKIKIDGLHFERISVGTRGSYKAKARSGAVSVAETQDPREQT